MQKSEQIKKAKSQTSLIQAYQNVFKTSDGEKVLKDLLFRCGILRDNFTGDVNLLLIREGERRVVLDILQKLNI